jgi:hypothetical protein
MCESSCSASAAKVPGHKQIPRKCYHFPSPPMAAPRRLEAKAAAHIVPSYSNQHSHRTHHSGPKIIASPISSEVTVITPRLKKRETMCRFRVRGAAIVCRRTRILIHPKYREGCLFRREHDGTLKKSFRSQRLADRSDKIRWGGIHESKWRAISLELGPGAI